MEVVHAADCVVIYHSISVRFCDFRHICCCRRFWQRYGAADPGRAEVSVGAVFGYGGQLHTVAQPAHQAVRGHINCPV